MLNQLNIYLKRPLISKKKELKISGSFCPRLHLEKTGPYCWGILNKIFIQNFYSTVNKSQAVKYNSHIDCVAGWKCIL
jgi:hypothetical protein